MSLEQLKSWTDKVEAALREAGNKKVLIPTVFTAAPKVLEAFEKTLLRRLQKREGPRTRNGKERAGMSRAYAQVYGYDRTWQIVQLRHCAL